ncbi:MAG TPA: helix-turn-helix domain-containing protein [Candidatus Acidoferrum sp.]|nr:helix-turn-helix domain-containing protein [Candidatus Acidoferrum sp.]
MPTTRPTKKQHELLEFIEAFANRNGYSPSYREIMRLLGYKSVSTVAKHIDNLVSRGHLRKRNNSARSLEVVHALRASASLSPAAGAHKKWLIAAIEQKFIEAEQLTKLPQQLIDELYALTETLRVLGFTEDGALLVSRLKSHVDQMRNNQAPKA